VAKGVYTKQATENKDLYTKRVEAFEKEHPGEIQRQKDLKSAAATAAAQLKEAAAGSVSLSVW
jgi:hypothetical protein